MSNGEQCYLSEVRSSVRCIHMFVRPSCASRNGSESFYCIVDQSMELVQAEWLPLHVTGSLVRLIDHQAVSNGIYEFDDGKDISCVAPLHSLCQ